MDRNLGRGATIDIGVEPGWHVYDSEGRRVGLVDDVHADRGTFSILQAGFGLGLLGGDFVVPRALIAGTCSDGITPDLTAAELDAYRIRR